MHRRGGVFRKNLHLQTAAIGVVFRMSFTGTVERGMVKLPPEITLPDGTEVRIEPLEKSRRQFASADLVGSVDGDGIPATNERVRKRMECNR